MTAAAARPSVRWRETIARIVMILLLAFVIFGPLANLVLWSFAERWYFPFKLPVTWGVRYWEVVFRPTGVAMASLATSISIALLTVDMAFRINAYGDYPVANALGVVSYLMTALVAWFYLRTALRERET